MAELFATRASIYDFLYQDTIPLVPLLADISQLSLNQARQAMDLGLQAIVSALLSFNQHQGGDAVLKKLLTRGSVKELRQYNAMNFHTLSAAYHQRQTSIDALFANSGQIKQSCEYIAKQIASKPTRVQTLLSTLTAISLREIAIITDYAQLNGEELDNWLKLQPQFLDSARFAEPSDSKAQKIADNSKFKLPKFDNHWYEITKFTPPATTNAQTSTAADNLPNYAKAIGRTAPQNHSADDVFTFMPMPSIHLPNQLWLLQLAKITDVYLGRKRLKINSEPDVPPTRPLINFGFKDNNSQTPSTASEKPIEYDNPTPLWKNPVIITVIVVLGLLTVLAFHKYQLQQKNLAEKIAAMPELTKKEEPQDVAIVKADDEDTPTNQDNPTTKNQPVEKTDNK